MPSENKGRKPTLDLVKNIICLVAHFEYPLFIIIIVSVCLGQSK
jgi:hypothetical protein